MTNNIRFLGIVRKAGRLEIGEENVGALARAKKAKVLLLAKDASENANHRAKNFAVVGNVPLIILPYTKEELGAELGVNSPAMMAICDIGMAAAFVSKLSLDDPEGYDEAGKLLSLKAEKALRRKKEAETHEKNVKMGKRRTK